MRKADANRVTRAAKKLRQAYEALAKIEDWNLTDPRERTDYKYFHSQLYQLSTTLEEWQEQMQREAE